MKKRFCVLLLVCAVCCGVFAQTAADYFNQGYAYLSQGDYDRAITALNQAIRLYPNVADAYFLRGSAYYYKGDYDRAIVDYEAALRINPNHANARQGLELARQAKGR